MKDSEERLMLNGSSCANKTIIEHKHRYYFARNHVEGKTVLDAACGTGYGSQILAGKAEKVYGIDLSAEAIEYAEQTYGQENICFQTMSVAKLDFPDAFFDVVVSFETIEHVQKETQHSFLKEIKRCLKPDGILLISTPNEELVRRMTRSSYFNPFHVTEFDLEGFYGFLKSEFKDVKMFYQNVTEVSTLLLAGERRELKDSICEDENNSFGQYYLAVCGSGKIDRIPENHVYLPEIKAYYDSAFFERTAVMFIDAGFGWNREQFVAAKSVDESNNRFTFLFSLTDYLDCQIRALRFDPAETSCRVQIDSVWGQYTDNRKVRLSKQPLNADRPGEMDVFYTPDPMYLITADQYENLVSVTVSGTIEQIRPIDSWNYAMGQIEKERAIREEQNKRIAEMDSVLAQEKSINEMLLNSRSWKITRPARTVGKLIRHWLGK